MKKNGFTLSELLGVIILLSILALITFPPIISQLKKSKEEMKDGVEKLIYSSADLYIKDRVNLYQKEEGETYCITLQELVNERYLQQDIEDENGTKMDLKKKVMMRVGKNGAITYALVNENQCTEVNHHRP